jgi:1,2-phenylacetyl-CoA epoxidase PaaB subunit
MSRRDNHVFEVFARFDLNGSVEHVGSVRGEDPVLAWQAAKEVFTRRERCLDLWVARRRDTYVGPQKRE